MWILSLWIKNQKPILFKMKDKHFSILLNQQLGLEQLHFLLQLTKSDGQVQFQQQYQYSFARQSIFIYIYDLTHSQSKWQIITLIGNCFSEIQWNQL
ncbi:unnamed protein product [Paramecium octaurelia]|uniref:Uncharacterized protein n=1 Tax=Paramecium octaurelia TaxID=43137 RepID=A0A8S1WIB0_PAROT|nr:unnamed protein product [Paramecium octaurelia]